jgi:regulator of protease activity HflC (stomatin/prohibitin superfamily)
MLLASGGGSSAGLVIGIIVAIIVFIILVQICRKSVRVVQQGNVGVVKRLGRYRPPVRQPGLRVVFPLVETIERVDIREEPRVGDLQQVITKDNVSVQVNATIYSQVVDVALALFEVSNYHVAVEQLARTALRAVFGGMTLDEALSERQRINTELQTHMSSATEKWGVRLNRIEIVDILPPGNILNAMSLQKEADQQKRAAILQSEGQQQAQINTAQGEKQAAVLRAEGDRQSAILRAEAAKQATILDAEAAKQSAVLRAEGNKEATVKTAEGRSSAIELVYRAIHDGNVTPELLAVLQLDTLGQVANSDNAKLVVPYETAGILGAAQALRSVLAGVPEAGGSSGATPPPPPASGAARGVGRALPPGR